MDPFTIVDLSGSRGVPPAIPIELALTMAHGSAADPGCPWSGRVYVAEAAGCWTGESWGSPHTPPEDRFRAFPKRVDGFSLLQPEEGSF